jgi:hypothetical protein
MRQQFATGAIATLVGLTRPSAAAFECSTRFAMPAQLLDEM